MHKTMKSYTDYLIEWLYSEREWRQTKGYVVGLSGGVDSAVVSFLLAKADIKNSLAVMMPCHSHKNDLDDAYKILDTCHLTHQVVDLSDTHRLFTNTLGQDYLMGKSESEIRVIDGNIRARLRMTTLFAIAQARGDLVVGTDNQIEWQMGYFTKFGDGGVDIAPLFHLMKDDVYRLAKYLGVPQSIIDKKPSGGLWENQTDEDEIGISYDEMNRAFRGEEVSERVKQVVDYWHKRSEHKRQMPRIPEKDLQAFLMK